MKPWGPDWVNDQRLPSLSCGADSVYVPIDQGTGLDVRRKGFFIVQTIGKLAQTSAALWILNVWFNRFNKDTGYRGGDATNMKEEFATYGLPESSVYVVGAAKVGLASALLAGHAKPQLVRPASIGLGAFMAGAIGMHIKVGDPVKRYLPALSVFTLSAVSAILNRPPSPTETATN